MSFLSKNMQLCPALKLSSWRKVAIGTWRTVGDPSVYGILEINVSAALAYIEKLRAKTGMKITLTHFTGKAVAETFTRHPQINCMLRFGRLYPRKNVDIFFQVASDATGRDLSGMTVREADKKSISDIAGEMHETVVKIREKGDPSFKRMKDTMGMLPGFMSKWVLGFSGFIMYTLNLWTPLFGCPKDPFGSVMITNIGSLGLDIAFAPLVPYSRVPVVLVLGAARETPVIENGKLSIGKVVRICATFDHRIIDGVHASHMTRTLLKIFENPEAELGPIEPIEPIESRKTGV